MVLGHGALEQLVPQRYFDAVAGVRPDHDGLDSRGGIPDTVTLGALLVGRRDIGKRLALVVLAIAVEVLIRLRRPQRDWAGRQGVIDVNAISCRFAATGVAGVPEPTGFPPMPVRGHGIIVSNEIAGVQVEDSRRIVQRAVPRASWNDLIFWTLLSDRFDATAVHSCN